MGDACSMHSFSCAANKAQEANEETGQIEKITRIISKDRAPQANNCRVRRANGCLRKESGRKPKKQQKANKRTGAQS